MILSLFLNGTFQAFVWPVLVKIISTLFSKSDHHNLILGFFGTSPFAGGTLGTLLSVYIKDRLSWKWVYPIPSVLIIFIGIVVFVYYQTFLKKILKTWDDKKIQADLKNKTDQQNVDDSAHNREVGDADLLRATNDNRNKSSTKGKNMSQSFWQHIKCSFVLMWDLPVVGLAALSMFCLKIIRYTLYMWLPFILEYTNEFSSTKAGNVSAIFEIGGVVGSILLGFLLDRCFSRSQLLGIVTFTYLQIVTMVAFLLTANTKVNWLINATFLLFVGLFVGGLDNAMSSSLPIFLAKSYKPDSASALVGIINGFGTLGTILQGPLVGFILDKSSTPKAPKVLDGLTELNSSRTSADPKIDRRTLPTNDMSQLNTTIDFRALFYILGGLTALAALAATASYLLYRKHEHKLSTTNKKNKDGVLLLSHISEPSTRQI
ncbi:uncharacterized protein LOC135925973 [Gordionus sp. m RMFG-2023]|uniref:uncharacterized protein LOC135925973 n=1 Tax=Gordionus sp. m RMFG-2023 TaxID=3053472 RepID=UPI0031FCF5C5